MRCMTIIVYKMRAGAHFCKGAKEFSFAQVLSESRRVFILIEPSGPISKNPRSIRGFLSQSNFIRLLKTIATLWFLSLRKCCCTSTSKKAHDRCFFIAVELGSTSKNHRYALVFIPFESEVVAKPSILHRGPQLATGCEHG